MTAENLPTMADVAARAGCARSTVSMALRQDPRIAAATRKRIEKLAREIGYKPNPLVAALMTSRRLQNVKTTHTILAFVTTHTASDPWRNYPPYLRFYDGAMRRAAELGYELQEFPLRAPAISPGRYLQILRTRNIHGLLIAPLPHQETAIELDLSGFAVVGVGLSIVTPPIERVSNDHFQSAVLAVRQCRSLGYRRIGLVVCRETSVRLEDRWLSGFLLACHGQSLKDYVPPLMPEKQEQITTELAPWCRREKPDVVLFGNYNPANPYVLPPGIDTVSLDVERLDSELTGIFQEDQRIGAIAVDHLVARLQRGEFGVDDRSRLHLLAGQWAKGRTARGLHSH